uniref:Uncharacterized protein n=1 Tax=Arundo donax TaxID=35708 RepID=A0A0A8XZQ0_ARUDO
MRSCLIRRYILEKVRLL